MLIQTLTTPQINDLVIKSFVRAKVKPAGDIRRVFMAVDGDWISNLKQINEVDFERYASVKLEGQSSVQRGIADGYKKIITRKTISVERMVSGEQYKTLTAHGLIDLVQRSAQDVVDRTELDLTHQLTFGDAASYTDMDGFTVDTTTADGLSIFNVAHTLKNPKPGNPTTYSNIVSGAPALSGASLEDAEDFFKYNAMDNYGQRISMNPNTLITTDKSTMVHRVMRLFTSSAPEKIGATTNANSGVANTYKNMYTHLVLPFWDSTATAAADATKSFYWAVACLGSTPETGLQAYFVRWLSPETAPVYRDESKWTMSMVARSAYGIGFVSGRGIVLSKATA
jgi:hypothetical protein